MPNHRQRGLFNICLDCPYTKPKREPVCLLCKDTANGCAYGIGLDTITMKDALRLGLVYAWMIVWPAIAVFTSIPFLMR